MEALQFDARTQILTLLQTDKPKLKSDSDVLIKVAYAGVCGTDLHIIEGKFKCNQEKPFTLGHEFCGQVVQIGKDVKTIAVGDRVVVDPNSGCHVCHDCHSGNPHYCKTGGINFTLGIYRDGGWANYCLAPEQQVHKLPDSITFELGALCEPLSCIAHAWDRIAPVTIGQRILIIGAGIIGNLWAINLHNQGHRTVTISEPNLARLQQVKQLDTGFELLTADALAQRAQTDCNYLFDLIIDCSGSGPAIEHAVTLMAPGGKFCIFGVAAPNTRISVSPYEMFLYEKTIIGAIINPFSFPKALGLINSLGDRYLNYQKLGIRVYKLNQYKEAIDELKKGTIAKAVFQL